MNRVTVAKELVEISKLLSSSIRVAKDMNWMDYMDWLGDLRVGDEVMLRWTAGSGGHYQGKAKLVRVNPKSVVGALLEDVTTGQWGTYPIGHKISLPRDMSDRKFSLDINSPWPIGIERISR